MSTTVDQADMYKTACLPATPTTSTAANQTDEYHNMTFPMSDDPPSSVSYQQLPSVYAAASQVDSDKDPGDFLDHLSEIISQVMTAHACAGPQAK